MLKRPPIELFRRIALAGVLVMVTIVVANYGLRRWRAELARPVVSGPIASDVQQQAEKFTFSRSEEGRVLFTVEAERTTERAGKTTVLEDVAVRIFGREGRRADEIRTGRCEYDSESTGGVFCPGEVRVNLRGEEGAATPGGIDLTTTALHFDPDQGAAWTAEPVQFNFSEGSGEAIGLRFQPQEPRIRLDNEVRIRFARGQEQPVTFEGERLEYFAGAQMFELTPLQRARSDGRTLTADLFRLKMSSDFRTERLEALGDVRAEMIQPDSRFILRGAQAIADYSAAGSVERLHASGGVVVDGRDAESTQRLTSREVVLYFAPGAGKVDRVVASGAADLAFETPAGRRTLRAPELEFRWRPRPQGQLLTATQRGTLSIIEKSGDRLEVTADSQTLELTGTTGVRGLSASGRVETWAARPGREPRTTRSQELRARFDAGGRLSAAEQWGEFHAQAGAWRAEAGRADYDSESGMIRLRQRPVAWDDSSRTTASLLELREDGTEVRAEGAVRTTRQASPASGFGGREPVQVISERMRALPEQGWARYEGKARLWQGESRLAADSIELFRSPEKLVGRGSVIALFPSGGVVEGGSGKTPVEIRAERFTYLGAGRVGVFEGEVRAEGEFGKLFAPRLEVRLAATSGDVESAHASGGVRLEQAGPPPGASGWQASGEVADYQADPPVVVLSGGTPTLSDPQRGSTRGARLTLFLADDRLVVDSAEGTRTVTRRPWSQ